MNLRPGTVSDARAIANLHVASWRWAYRDLMPAATLADLSVDARARNWAALLARQEVCVFVGEREGVLAGFAACGPAREPGVSAGIGELYAIYLDESATGTGVGAALLANALAALAQKGFSSATLWVLEGNQRARRFYERHGFRLD